MKHPHKKWLLLLPLLLSWAAARAQPDWSVDPAPYQYGMTMVAQIKIDGVPNQQLNNHLALFAHGQIRGYATPVEFGGQAYYFLNLFSNQYQNDTLNIRGFIGADQKVYESVDTVLFRHHDAKGTVGTPFQVRLHLGDRPLIYTLSEVNYLANSCADVLDIQSTDKQNSEGAGLTYSIAGGSDAGRFMVQPQTGMLSWHNFVPDFNMPQDANGDNHYEVDVQVSDATNLTDVQHFTIIVVNTAPPPPPLVCPPSVTLSSSSDGTGDCGATTTATAIPLTGGPCAASLITYQLSGATNGGGTGLVPPGQVFGVGTTQVYYFRSGFECPFYVTVNDDEPPTITCPANQTVSANSSCSGTVGAWAAAAKGDNCTASGDITVSQSPASNTMLSGYNSAQTVTLTAEDTHNNTNTCTFTVTLMDVTPPTVTCPANQTISVNSACSAPLGAWAAASKSDNCTASGAITVNQSPAASTVLSGHNTAQTVTLTADDTHGNTGTCTFTVTLKDVTPPTVTCPGNQTVAPTIFNPCSAVVSGINASFSDNCSGASLAYTRTGVSSGGGSGQASGQTFLVGATTVTYTATDATGLSATCSFSVTVSNCNTIFSGNVKWEQDTTLGVQTTIVSLTGSATGSATTDVNGFYQITIPPITGNFTLKPAKNINKLNGVTTADVTAIQQHVANVALLPGPFKRIAADVNKSNSINTTDASVLNQALLGNQSALNQITASWRFVPSSYTFPNPAVPWGFPEQIDLTNVTGFLTGQHFKGIKVGDVVSTWANPANFGPESSGLVLHTRDVVLQAGQPLTAEFLADQMSDLNSFQFTLHFDPDQLELTGIEPAGGGVPLSLDNFGTYHLADGEIRVAWAQASSIYLAEAAPLFRLHFTALENGAQLSEVLQLAPGDADLPGRVYNSAYAESGVALRYSAATGTGGPDNQDNQDNREGLSLRNRPNPFKEKTMLRFVLPEAGEAELRVSDTSGRLLFSQKKYYAAGRQEETLVLPGVCGVLFAELVTEQGSVVRRLLAVW